MSMPERIVEAIEALNGTLLHFIGSRQQATLRHLLQGEEGMHFAEILIGLKNRIDNMPKSYETDGQGHSAIVHLHYFFGSFDAWITEKDAGDGSGDERQHQAFGWVSFNGKSEAELGYASIEEFISSDVGIELDLYWEPKPYKDVT
ncbi:hypothetical protein [Methyloversatilis sp.]|uniref:hypothetical protein n=1 Tax=Methyloversatilis sp. TaxID=2569862 RepID=UPI0035B04BB9